MLRPRTGASLFFICRLSKKRNDFMVSGDTKSGVFFLACGFCLPLSISACPWPSQPDVEYECLPIQKQHNGMCDPVIPLAAFFPNSTYQVAEVVQFSVSEGIPFTVKGGGHSYICEYVRVYAIQINLRLLASVTVDRDEKTITAGGGATFSDVFRKMKPSEHAFAHGGCHTVGVGGYFLHGGIHAPATRLTGLGNETVERMTVVLANSTVITNLSAANPMGGLWDMMRVAGSFFGIATSITFRYYDEPEATFFAFLVPLSEEDYIRTHLSFLDTTREGGNGADVTMDGSGPNRALSIIAEGVIPELYIFEVSVRDNRPFQPWAAKWARAYFHLLSHLPWGSVPIPLPKIDDLSLAYEVTGGSWVSTFMCLPFHCDLKAAMELVVGHYNEFAYTDNVKWCWSVYSTSTSFDGRMCFEYNCPDMEVFRREIPRVEKEVGEICPDYTKYWNVPSLHPVKVDKYFSNWGEILEEKKGWDPHGWMMVWQGS